MEGHMAQRVTTKAAKRERAPRAVAPSLPPAAELDVAALQQALADARAELEAARARIAELERSRADVLNRIDWVIDSLHNLGER